MGADKGGDGEPAGAVVSPHARLVTPRPCLAVSPCPEDCPAAPGSSGELVRVDTRGLGPAAGPPAPGSPGDRSRARRRISSAGRAADL